MKAENFCYWLQGFFEITDPEFKGMICSSEQILMIRKHLNMVFAHDIDPKMGDAKHQQKLNDIHNPERPILFRC